MANDGHSLAARVGELLQDERAKRQLSQAALAERAGTSQQCVSLIEHGRSRPTTAQLDRLFGALGLQVRVEAEAAGSDSDAEIETFERLTEDERISRLSAYDRRLDQLGDLPYVLTGRLAAFAQGAPVRVDRLDLVVAECDLDRFAAWFASVHCQRWNEQWEDWGFGSVDPREPGLPMRWLVGYDEVRLEVVPGPPAAITVCWGERRVRVRPLADIEREYPDVGRLTRRVRARAGAPGPA